MWRELRAACLALAWIGCSRELPSEPVAPVAAEPLVARAPAPGIAVVELFTSEGCSSCPAADRALARIAEHARSDAAPIYVLSFHVDYWNYLGWADRFSSARYSQRQRDYGPISEGGGTYTPQAVVNGNHECVGSNAARLDDLIQGALAEAPRTRIELRAERAPRSVRVSYRVTGDAVARVLNLALVEPRAESRVEDGENAGERLKHVNVVRAFVSHPLAAGTAGELELPLIDELRGEPVGVVAYAEGVAQTDISGASALDLP